MTNFKFLKTIDNDLYSIISEAEKLYRDEYFEQSIAQTRKFAENVCKKVLGKKRTTEKTFDDMLATLKDKSKTTQEKEFIEDLYFIKREGNNSLHSSTLKKDGIIALECVQRAFEVAINYAVYYCKSSDSLLKLRYDIELLVTGKRNKTNLSDKYNEKKDFLCKKNQNKAKRQTKKKSTAKQKPKKISFFEIILLLSIIISLVLILTIYLFTTLN